MEITDCVDSLQKAKQDAVKKVDALTEADRYEETQENFVSVINFSVQ